MMSHCPKVKIDPSLMDPTRPEVLEKAVQDAVNNAFEKEFAAMAEAMGPIPK